MSFPAIFPWGVNYDWSQEKWERKPGEKSIVRARDHRGYFYTDARRAIMIYDTVEFVRANGDGAYARVERVGADEYSLYVSNGNTVTNYFPQVCIEKVAKWVTMWFFGPEGLGGIIGEPSEREGSMNYYSVRVWTRSAYPTRLEIGSTSRRELIKEAKKEMPWLPDDAIDLIIEKHNGIPSPFNRNGTAAAQGGAE